MWPPVISSVAIDQQFVRILDTVQREVSAARSANNSVSAGYIEWSMSALRQLRGVLSTESLDRLVRTPTFWAVHAHSRPASMAVALIIEELDYVEKQLKELADASNQFNEHWHNDWEERPQVVVLDTSALMGIAPSVSDLDWAERLGIDPVRVVVDELDNLKDRGQGTAKGEARRLLRWLEDELPVPEGSGRSLSSRAVLGDSTVSVEALLEPLEHIRLASADDEIVRQASLLADATNLPTQLATRDTGLLLRARQAGVDGVRVEKLLDE
jgi:hypothetical protein